MSAKVVISGVGAITSAGIDIKEILENLEAGKPKIGTLSKFSYYKNKRFTGAEVPYDNEEIVDFLEDEISSHKSLPAERGEIFFFKALEEALESAGLNKNDLKGKRVGIFIGSDTSGITSFEKDYKDYITNGSKLSLKSQFVFSMQTLLERVAFEYEIEGPRFIYSTACSASLHAVIWGSEYIKNNEIDIAIVGGTDPMTSISMAGFASLKALAEESCSPFSTKDVGISVGEGAGVMILENNNSMTSREHSSELGIIAGYASTSDAYHQTASDPTGKGINKCITNTINLCNIDEVDKIFVSAHGTGTDHNDKIETRGLKQAFIDHEKLHVSSIKSMIGHTLGASGVIELALMSKSFASSKLLPTANFTENRIGCDLNYIKNESLEMPISFGIKNSFAFGGNNTCVALTNDDSLIKEKKSRDNVEIVIIGVGSISSAGIDIDEINQNNENNISSISDYEDTNGFIRTKRTINKVAKVSDEIIEAACKKLRIKNHRKMDRISKLATIAAVNACKDAGLKIGSKEMEDIALIGNTATGHSESVDSFFRDIVKNGLEGGDPNKFPNTVLNAHLGHISVELKSRGYTVVISQSNALSSLELGKNILLSGQADTVVVGATAEFSHSLFKGYIDNGVINNDMNPYTKDSKGYVFGEGSAFLVLEKKSVADAKSRKIYGSLEKINVHCSPLMPRTHRYTHNTLQDLGSVLKDKESIKNVYGCGSGIKMRDTMEIQNQQSNFKNSTLHTYSPQIGYVPGVMSILNIALWAKSDKEDAVFTEVVEGGSVGLSYIKRVPSNEA